MISRILIVEDNAESRRWLRGLVDDVFPGARIVCVGDVRGALRECGQGQFDLALVDLGLPDGSGLDVLRHLRDTRPETLGVVTTVMAGDSDIVAALSAGSQGYLLKGEPDERVKRHLSQLSEGVLALSPQIARRIMEHFRMTGPVIEPEGKLTNRERDVLSLIARGLRVVDVATALDLAESTVASHVKSIYRKLGISSRAEAAIHASRLGLFGGEGSD